MIPALRIITIIITIAIWLAFGYFSYRLRQTKGYSGGLVTGFLFGLFALIYNAGLPDLIARSKIDQLKLEINNKKNYSKPNSVFDKVEDSNATDKQNTASIKDKVNIVHMWRCNNCGEMISSSPCPKCGYDNK